MASTKTRIKPIRIANETADFFEGKPLNRIVECIHQMILSGTLILDGEEISVNGVPQKTIDGIKEMGEIAGLTLAEMLAQYLKLMEEGYLMYEDDGRILPMKEEWEEELEALCRSRGLTLEEVGRWTMDALRKGVL